MDTIITLTKLLLLVYSGAFYILFFPSLVQSIIAQWNGYTPWYPSDSSVEQLPRPLRWIVQFIHFTKRTDRVWLAVVALLGTIPGFFIAFF